MDQRLPARGDDSSQPDTDDARGLDADQREGATGSDRSSRTRPAEIEPEWGEDRATARIAFKTVVVVVCLVLRSSRGARGGLTRRGLVRRTGRLGTQWRAPPR